MSIIIGERERKTPLSYSLSSKHIHNRKREKKGLFLVFNFCKKAEEEAEEMEGGEDDKMKGKK